MTEMLKTWLCNILFTAVIGSAAYYLLPPGRMEKGLKTVISLCILSAVLLPLASFGNESIDAFETIVAVNSDVAQEYRRNIDLSMQSDFKAAVESEIRTTLEKIGAGEEADIYTEIESDENGRIIIKKVELHIGEEDTAARDEISEKVQTITGVAPDIFVKGEGG